MCSFVKLEQVEKDVHISPSWHRMAIVILAGHTSSSRRFGGQVSREGGGRRRVVCRSPRTSMRPPGAMRTPAV